MALPENVLSSTGVGGTYVYPDNLVHTPFLDYEMAGSAIGVGLDGLLVKVWTCFYEDNAVKVLPLGDAGPATTLFSLAGITELSFSFDRSMRPAVAYMKDFQGFLYWYDTTINAYVTSSLGFIRSPRVTHDDKRYRADQTSDVLVAYLKNDALCYRQQRDRYTVERILASGIPIEMKLTQAAMTDQFRVEFQVDPI